MKNRPSSRQIQEKRSRGGSPALSLGPEGVSASDSPLLRALRNAPAFGRKRVRKLLL
ncbi:MAG TPA: hypothetical protein VGR78_19325 [Verrucomicrobiae bacterium]|nr:hypothetical protein [Verrucomicrobiae bacterium]